MYRTGDRVRLRPDGEFEFFGRFDRQVKIAGHRVDLDALEGALSECAQVAQAAAIAISSAEGEKRLVACVVLADRSTNADQNRDPEADLREWAAQRLPQVSIPRRWIFLDRLPLGSRGKVDRVAIEALCGTPVQQKSAEPNQTKVDNEIVGEGQLSDVCDTAEYIRRLWSRLLGRDSIGLEENFFDLGGTSLLLIEMHSRLSDKFSAVPPLVDLFGFPTVNALAERLCGRIDRRSASLDGRNRGERERAAMLARRRTRLATLTRNNSVSTSATATGDQRP
jgi:acyl carrier protein